MTLPPPVIMTQVVSATNKKHLVTQIVVTFSNQVNTSEAQRTTIYRLANPGKHGSFTAKNAKVIKLRSAAYSAANDTVTLTPKKPFSLSKAVQLQVDGTSPSGLQDTFGRFIDGGINAVAVLHRGGATITAATHSSAKRNAT